MRERPRLDERLHRADDALRAAGARRAARDDARGRRAGGREREGPRDVRCVAEEQRTHADLLASYLVELTLQEYNMLKYLPSTIAAASTYLALKTMGQQSWTPELQQHACYTEAAILPCVRDINALHKNASANNLQAVRKKYAQEKHGSVSGIPPISLA